jgi:phage-related protein
MPQARLRWRDYRTRSGGRPVKDFIDSLTDEEAASVVAAMREIALDGLVSARHLRGDIYEAYAYAESRDFRILFSHEAKFVLLSLSAFTKKTQKTPRAEIEVAEKRLRDWRQRGIGRRHSS